MMDKRNNAMNALWEFTCKTCGGHDVTVTHVWNILAGVNGESWQEWGPLEASHCWHYSYKEKVEKKEEEDKEVKRGDYGAFSEDDSDSEPEVYEVVDYESDPESDEFYVNCANCDREIEFGWSQLDRQGLIFPVELSDFDPLKIFPDPKYVEFWQQKGWLRAGHLQAETTAPNALS
jgi:hypothetical protein